MGSLQFLPLLLGSAKDSSSPIPPWEILKIPKVDPTSPRGCGLAVGIKLGKWLAGWLAGMSRRLVSYQPVKLVSQFCL